MIELVAQTSGIIGGWENLKADNNPGLDDNLRDVYGFDSIDAITLLAEIEKLLGSPISQEDKKRAMDIRTINHICDYIESLI